MFVAIRIDANRRDEKHVLIHVNAVALIASRSRSSSRLSIHAFMRAADSATKRREVADFDSPAPSGAGTSPSGNRTNA